MSNLSAIKVPGIGPSDAKIALVGESPGYEENKLQEPFVGTAGKILGSMLNQVGLMRNECYITNVVKHQPSKNNIGLMFTDSKNTKPTERMLEYRQELKEELEAIKPNVAVALGRTALWALTGQLTIQKHRGSVMSSNLVDGLKVIPTIHPAAVGRQWSPWRQVVPLDLDRAKKEQDFPEIRRPKRDYTIRPTFDEAMTELKRLEKVEFLSFDIETRPVKIVTIGFSDHPSRAICIPFTSGYNNYWKEEEEIEIWKQINKILSNPKSKKVAQNAQYDILYLARFHGIIVQKFWIDTMVAHHELYPEFPKSLQFLTSMWTDEPFYKDEGKSHGGRVKDEALWIYNCKDAAITLECAHEIYAELVEEDLYKQYLETMSYHEALMTMTLQGVNFDRTAQTRLIQENGAKIKELQESLDRSVGEPLNVNSNKQMVQFLYIKLGLPIVTGATKKPTANMDALLGLRRRFPKFKPILDIIIALRKLRKLKSAFLEVDVDAIDKRIRCNYNVAGTETWRLSSSKSIFGGGTNLQTIPKGADEEGVIRKLFIPDPGFIMGAVDLSQAEARVVAWLSDDELAISEFEGGKIDVHTAFAARLFAQDYDELKAKENGSKEEKAEYKHMRNLGKLVRHATNYGMTFVGLIKNCLKHGVYLSAAEAKKLLKDAERATPMLSLYHRNVREQLKARRTLITPLGKRRQFGGRLMGKDAVSTYREGYAFIPQSVVGVLANRGLQRMYVELCDKGLDLLLQVHDEVVFQFKKDDPMLAWKAKDLMVEDIMIRGRNMCIPADLKVGLSWGAMEEIKTEPHLLKVVKELKKGR